MNISYLGQGLEPGEYSVGISCHYVMPLAKDELWPGAR
jgi:hypothetical protein